MIDIISKFRNEYAKIVSVHCPYARGDVLFTSSGFKHLIWKSNRSMRSLEEITHRCNSLLVATEILKKTHTLQEFEKINVGEYLCFIAIIRNKKYKVVILKKNIGGYKFISVIPKWKTGKRDNV